MPRGSRFGGSRGRRRDTVTPADQPAPKEHLGSFPGSPLDVFSGSTTDPNEQFSIPFREGLFTDSPINRAVQTFQNVHRGIGETVAEGIDIIDRDFERGKSASELRRDAGEGISFDFSSIFGSKVKEIEEGQDQLDPVKVQEALAAAEAKQIAAEILREQPFINQQTEDAIQLIEDEAAREIAVIDAQLVELEQNKTGFQNSFDRQSEVFSHTAGTFATVDEARADPEIAEILDNLDAAMESGTGIEAALDALQGLPSDVIDDLSNAADRDMILVEQAQAIRTQVHNLVENRQQIEDAAVEAEEFIRLEAQAQENPMWDPEGDASPSGRGYDIALRQLTPWLDSNFNGVLTEEQDIWVEEKLNAVWQTVPSQEVLTDEDGVPIPEDEEQPTGAPVRGTLAERQAVIDGETVGVSTTRQIGDVQLAAIAEIGAILGFPPAKAQEWVDEVVRAFAVGETAMQQAENWEESTTLTPGGTALGHGIYEVALEIYDDMAEASQMTNSRFLHRIIQIRSGGDVLRDEGKDGNQFGLGNLPEHTYVDLGYNDRELKQMETDPKLQLEALLRFVGEKYAPGYGGLQMAMSDLVHNPNAWGDFNE